MGKIKKRIFVLLLTVVLVVGVAIAGIGYYCQSLQSDNESREEIALEDGQYLKYARIDSISGNELTYTVMEEQTAGSDQAQNPQKKQSGLRSENPQGDRTGQRSENPQGDQTGQRSENPQGNQAGQRSENPQGDQTGQRSENPQGNRTGQRSENPQGDQTGQRSENPQGDQTGQKPENQQKSQQESAVTYAETTETGQLLIPVGTEVITKLGTSTTFSRLSNGDIIGMVLQKDGSGNEVVMKIKIVG